jgi:hypothetical protein
MNQQVNNCPINFLAQYKDIFGKPREGIHSYRFMNFAIADTLLTIALAFIIALIFNLDLITCIIITFIVGELSHYLFCVDTQFILLIKHFFK